SYVTGFFPDTATFGPGETNETMLTSAGGNDVFVAKYDSLGDLVWAKRAGGTARDEGFGIAVDSSGNSYVTGQFNGTAIFGPGEATETTLTSAGFQDVFVAKYDSLGDLVWAKRAGGTSADDGLGIGVDSSGNSYVTGRFRDTATFGPGEANETMLTSVGVNDVFVAKYDSLGDLVWAKRAGGTGSLDEGFGIAVDSSGNSYVTGQFTGTATFGPGEINETMLTSAGFSDVFVAKYDSTGALVWAKQAGGTSFDEGRGIAVDGSGNSYVTGIFRGTATFGPGEANETMLTSAGGSDVFVAKLGGGSPCASLAPTMGCRVNGRAGQLCQGTNGNDVILGTAGPDVIYGLGGHDAIVAGNGNDTVCGGHGNDALIGGNGDDDLFGEGGRDILSGDRDNDSLDGGPDRDACSGGLGTDTAENCEATGGVP
ncbi:MAG: SBBP repeat-containing protein, partial [Gammaproteobacteria bacterium]